MKGQMFVIQTNGDITMKHLDVEPELVEMQAAVGGWLESVPHFDRWDGKQCVAFCNEEGKIVTPPLPLNAVATMRWKEQLGVQINDVLVGPVVILTGDADFMKNLRNGVELTQDG